jgi:hypothetical protein
MSLALTHASFRLAKYVVVFAKKVMMQKAVISERPRKTTYGQIGGNNE